MLRKMKKLLSLWDSILRFCHLMRVGDAKTRMKSFEEHLGEPVLTVIELDDCKTGISIDVLLYFMFLDKREGRLNCGTLRFLKRTALQAQQLKRPEFRVAVLSNRILDDMDEDALLKSSDTRFSFLNLEYKPLYRSWWDWGYMVTRTEQTGGFLCLPGENRTGRVRIISEREMKSRYSELRRGDNEV